MPLFPVKKEDILVEIAGIRAAAPVKAGEGEDEGENDDMESNGDAPQSRAAKASELLVIDIKNISATLDDAVWSFEQTYLPYLKGSGKANARLWSGAIRLTFELRRRKIDSSCDDNDGGNQETWEPVLCLNDRSCTIGGVELVIQVRGLRL